MCCDWRVRQQSPTSTSGIATHQRVERDAQTVAGQGLPESQPRGAVPLLVAKQDGGWLLALLLSSTKQRGQQLGQGLDVGVIKLLVVHNVGAENPVPAEGVITSSALQKGLRRLPVARRGHHAAGYAHCLGRLHIQSRQPGVLRSGSAVSAREQVSYMAQQPATPCL